MAERQVGRGVLRVVRGDITNMEVEAFVHDITSDLKLGSGFGSAIQQRGGLVIQKELDEHRSLPVGEAILTRAGILKASYIIHVNGPKFREEDEESKLRSAISAALLRAEEQGITQLAIPAIGTGLYQVPLDLCARVMVDTVTEHMANGSHLKEVLIVSGDTRDLGAFEARVQEGA